MSGKMISKLKNFGIVNVLLISSITSSPSLADVVLKSGPERVHLLELYSTQSCSSCPPAQKWVSELKSDGQLWKGFIPVVFHVDYWDYLGWKDPYSDAQFSQRQRGYVSELTTTGYTPMFIIDGEEVRRNKMSKIRMSPGKVGVLSVRSRGGRYSVEFAPESRNLADLKLHYAVLGNGISTDVTDGENNGRKLAHDFLILHKGEAALKKAGNKYSVNLKIETKKTKAAPEKALVFWVSKANSFKPIQATGGPIKE